MRESRTSPIHAYLLAKEEARRAAGGAMKQSEGASPATRTKSEAIFMVGRDEVCVLWRGTMITPSILAAHREERSDWSTW